jgi:hypothetical protein
MQQFTDLVKPPGLFSVQFRASRQLETGKTSIALAIVGIVLFIIWWITNNGSTTSLLLLLLGVSIVLLSIFLYFSSPYRYQSSEISDAMAISNALNLYQMLSFIAPGSSAIYLPATQSCDTKAMIMLPEGIDYQRIASAFGSTYIFKYNSDPASMAISLIPPGYGLYEQAVKLGASFSSDNLGNDISDVIKNGLEIASSAYVRQADDQLFVRLENINNAAMCRSVRANAPNICTTIGCPICSLVSCMVANGTGMNAKVTKVETIGRSINLTYKLKCGTLCRI